MLYIVYIHYIKPEVSRSTLNSQISTHRFKIIITIIIIKVSIIKFYSIKVHIITKECNNIRVYIIKVYIIIREYQSGTNINPDRQASKASSHLFESCIYQGKYFSMAFFGNNFITHCLSLILITNIFYCRRTNINSFILLFALEMIFI